MAVIENRAATYADIQALPPNMVGQILFGTLHAHPRPAPRHALASSKLVGNVLNRFGRDGDEPGGWIILFEPELHLSGHVVVPDIAGWRREHMPVLPDTAYFDVAPDWICEVLSPSTAQIDRTDKLTIYADQKVGHCWYVDPDAQTLEVFALCDGAWRLEATFKGNDIVSAVPFEVHEFALDALWTI